MMLRTTISAAPAAPCCSVLGRAAPRCAALRLFSAAPRCSIPPRCTQPLPGWAKSDPGLWQDAAYDVLETRGIMPVSDWVGECCFAVVRAPWLQQLHVRGSSWGQQLEGKSEQARDEIYRRFLEQCGAKPTSGGLSLCSLPTSTYCSAAPAAKSVVQRALLHLLICSHSTMCFLFDSSCSAMSVSILCSLLDEIAPAQR